MRLILFDDQSWDNLLPLTFTRPVSALRVGILTIGEKWETQLGLSASVLTRPYLSEKYPAEAGEDNLLVNGSLIPDSPVVQAVIALRRGESLALDGKLIAARTGAEELEQWIDGDSGPTSWMDGASRYEGEVSWIDYPWKIFALNGQEITADFERITGKRKSTELDRTVTVLGNGAVFAEPGFTGGAFTLNTASGPVYLGKDSEIMEGCLIRGPFALCEGSTVKMGAKIYGPTTIGPFSKAGGEINNSVIQAFSNKTHDGFLGNAVLGEWCNLGADTNNSNLKNNYSEARLWNYPERQFIKTGRQFCGLFMGDHSKSGINTMFNTATLVGVSANIFGPGFPHTFIPSFSWGGASGFNTYRLDKAMETAQLIMERRGIELTEADRRILVHVFETTAEFRANYS